MHTWFPLGLTFRLVWFPCSPGDSQESSLAPEFVSIKTEWKRADQNLCGGHHIWDGSPTTDRIWTYRDTEGPWGGEMGHSAWREHRTIEGETGETPKQQQRLRHTPAGLLAGLLFALVPRHLHAWGLPSNGQSCLPCSLGWSSRICSQHLSRGCLLMLPAFWVGGQDPNT